MLLSELKRAITNNTFSLVYQPQVCLLTGNVVGVEALLRFESETQGQISPAEFIPLAERSDLIIAIGDWVLAHACEEFTSIPGYAAYTLSINLSAKQLADPQLGEKLQTTLASNALKPAQCIIELTETANIDNLSQATIRLNQLANKGVRIALDDFATGYSSFGHLKAFPVSRIKIDKSFVMDCLTCPISAAILDSLFQLSQSMHIEAVVEGVETLDQLRWLVAHGAQIGQGYYLSKPMSITAFREYLAVWDGAHLLEQHDDNLLMF